ncbi:MAG TPA: matrixin family metalloprotease [Fimbriimonas sp.]
MSGFKPQRRRFGRRAARGAVLLSGLSALFAPGCVRETLPLPAPIPRQVAIVPFRGIDPESVDIARRSIEARTYAKVIVLAPEDLPRKAYYAPRNRYRAETLLDHLGRKPYGHVIGLTRRDISTTHGPHIDWGIFGLGSCPGKACVVSTFRLGGRKDRLAKVVVHEFGHTLGLPHCPTPKCLMNDARGRAATVDAETGFCDDCRKAFV